MPSRVCYQWACADYHADAMDQLLTQCFIFESVRYPRNRQQIFPLHEKVSFDIMCNLHDIQLYV